MNDYDINEAISDGWYIAGQKTSLDELKADLDPDCESSAWILFGFYAYQESSWSEWHEATYPSDDKDTTPISIIYRVELWETRNIVNRLKDKYNA